MKNLHLLTGLLFLSVYSYAQTARSIYEEGLKLKNENKSTEAVKSFQKALQLDPSFTDARYELAWAQNDVKDYTNALTNLRTVRQQWPLTPKVYYELGYAFDKMGGQTDSAIAAYNKCLSIKTDYNGAYKQLAYIEYSRENNSEALNNFKNCIAASKDEITDYLFWYRKGYTENALKDYENAIQSLLKSENLKKDYVSTYLELGFAYCMLKKNDEAITSYNRAKEIDPNNHVAYNGIAEVYRDNYKDYNRAIELYKETLKVKADERKACFGIGYCLNSSRQYSEAIDYLKIAIREEPNYIAAYTELGYSYYKTGDQEGALYNLNKAISLNPNTNSAYYYAAQVYIMQKKKAKAQEMLNGYSRSGKDASALQKQVDAL